MAGTEPLGVVFFLSGEAPDRQRRRREGDGLRDGVDGDLQAVVRVAADVDRHYHRHVEDRHDERHPRRFVPQHLHVVDRSRTEDEVRIPFVVGDDRDQARLGAGLTFVRDEDRRAASEDRPRVAEHALGHVDVDVVDDLRLPGFVDFEPRGQVGVAAGLLVRRPDREFGDVHTRRRSGGKEAEGNRRGDHQEHRTQAHRHPLLARHRLTHACGSSGACASSGASSSRTGPASKPSAFCTSSASR